MAHRDSPDGPGAVSLAGELMAPSESLRQRVLGSIRPRTRLEGFVDRVAQLFDLTEARTRELLDTTAAVSEAPWVATPFPSTRLLHFEGGPRRRGADCGLVQVAVGAQFPRHRHLGLEWNFVLAGSAEEDSGQVWLPGDLVMREPESVHGYRVLSDEPALFAVVLEGGIELT